MHSITKGNKEKIEEYLQNLGYVFLEGDCIGGISRFVVASKERIDKKLELLPELVRRVQLIDIYIGNWESDFVFTTNDLRILKYLIQKPRMKAKDIAQATHVSQKTVKRRIDSMLFNRIIDFTILVNPRQMKGYVNVGIFIHVENKYREEVTKEIYEEIKDLLMFGSPYENIDTMRLNLYVENMWEIERIQNKAESMKGIKKVSIILPLRRRYSQELLIKEIDRSISKPIK